MTPIRIIILSMLIIVFYGCSSEAGWLIYHKPAFQGKVIDAETMQPIEGAVVVVVYEKGNWNGPGGGYTSAVKVKETLTDKNGEFKFPSYTTLILPFFSEESFAEFIIYKPGYGNFSASRTYPPGDMPLDVLEKFFTGDVGKEGELPEVGIVGGQSKIVYTWKVFWGVVELPKLKTREERIRNIPSLPSELEFLEEQKKLIQLINEEEVNLGLEKSDPYRARDFILHRR